jgi:hypothetical protein
MKANTLAALVVLAAVPAGQNYFTGSSRWTAISGKGGSFMEALTPMPPYGGLGIESLTFGENSDDPVMIEADGYGVGPGGGDYDFGRLRLESPNQSSIESVGYNNGFITAVQICMNSDRTKLKGARVWGVDHGIGSGDPVVTLPQNEFRRPNCSRWETKVACPNGQIANGIRGYYNGSIDSFHGISLRCQRPDW